MLTEAEYEEALKNVDGMMDVAVLAEQRLAELLDAIEEYENKYHPIDDPEMLPPAPRWCFECNGEIKIVCSGCGRELRVKGSQDVSLD